MFELFETRASPFLGRDMKLFEPVSGELLDSRLDFFQFLPAPFERRTRTIAPDVIEVGCGACGRYCSQCLDVGKVPHDRPALGAHLQTVSVLVGPFQ